MVLSPIIDSRFCCIISTVLLKLQRLKIPFIQSEMKDKILSAFPHPVTFH